MDEYNKCSREYLIEALERFKVISRDNEREIHDLKTELQKLKERTYCEKVDYCSRV